MEQRQLGVSYANTLVEGRILQNFNDPSFVGSDGVSRQTSPGG